MNFVIQRNRASGHCADRPYQYQIKDTLRTSGYYCNDHIQIWYDDKESIWKWTTDVISI